MAKKISAVVCVYNREDTLPQCLEALAQQTISTDLFEVIVVDNNSTDGSPEIAAKYAAKYPHMRVVRETKQGLASARNCGMREAKSPIAAFTDDDAIPAKDWAERLLQRFDELGESAAVVGGELDPVWSSPKPDWLQGDKLLHSLSVCLGWSTHARYLIGSEWLCEANSAYRIAPVQERGGFPENLGRIGTNLLSGENAINAVLVRDGYRFFFDPEIRVQHQINKARLSKDWFRRRFFWQGVTTFLVNQYLRDQGCVVEASAMISVPMNEASWDGLCSDGSAADFDAALGQLYGMGYFLAASNLLGGR
ncbi:glycosyltransferase [Pseudophaeobacter arcticus]|jgi:glycosyltransferase involved in cell wall biosynthesis|uniref:glycosyltransferase n=1 Tax=Pseudophaeobacter arcticus TaxID=385492 RepID=UPI0004871601|nr:glycosyltransferase [Pseudophaeobacter arcticus]